MANNVLADNAGHETTGDQGHGETGSVAPMPRAKPAASATAAMGSEQPVFDLRAFERTAIFLKPEAVASYLQTIATTGEALLRDLQEPAALLHDGEQLGEAAHTLAGSAGMLGFERLATVGRRFERAIQSCMAEAPGLADALTAALEATLQEIHDRMSAAVGAGLGLALSARLAATRGGRRGSDDSPGGGSVVWLELPMSADPAPYPVAMPPSDAHAVQPVPAGASTLRVLVVDDISMNRDFAGSFLRAAGHGVTCVESGADAVAAVATTDFDVIFMDVCMPSMGGLEATRRIRALEGTRRRVPIVALTARAFAEQVAECRAAGMDDHLLKPFDPDTLLAAVERATVTGRGSGISVSLASLPIIVTPVPASPVIGTDLPVFDRNAFDRTAIFLAPEAVASYLQAIAERGEPLLRGLWRPDALTRTRRELAEAALTLAGSAGMLGFERLAALGRRFDRAIQSDTADAPALADGLGAALEATLQEIHTHMSATLGAGLGLALSARLAAVMGGRRAPDGDPGGPDVFWHEMPLDIIASPLPTVAGVSDEPDRHPVPAAAGVLRVLVVDDVAMNRDIAESFLRSAGHHVICVKGGAEAVSAVALTDFDVVLMDVRMPEIDGLEATRRIRALEGTRRQVPIVAVTAQIFDEQVAECRKAGMNSHLPKPFDPDMLIAAAVRTTKTPPLAWRESDPL